MKIYIENQVLEYKNDRNEIDNILNEIDNIVNKSSKILSHMVIDHFEVYESYYDYFLDNIKVIEKVEVVSVTYKELIDNILNSTLDYLERTPEAIDNLANSFYKNPNGEAWDSLNDLLSGIAWIMDTFSSIDQDNRLKDVILSYEAWNLYSVEVFSLKEVLAEFEQGLLNRDNVLIADILSYEISAYFKNMSDILLILVNRDKDLFN